MALPPTLEKLTFGLKFNQSLEGGELGNWDWDAATLQHTFFLGFIKSTMDIHDMHGCTFARSYHQFTFLLMHMVQDYQNQDDL